MGGVDILYSKTRVVKEEKPFDIVRGAQSLCPKAKDIGLALGPITLSMQSNPSSQH